MKKGKGEIKKDSNGSNNGYSEKLTFGQRAADFLTEKIGSWTFILVFMFIVIIWMIINVIVILQHWDPYPFIFLNLVLSCIAAIQAPVILMSQNRQNEIDRARSKLDYYVDRKTQRETDMLLDRLDRIERKLDKLK
ncbi:MAG TPA: DUF1003 domain-containing protein [Candidatus Nanoarchaeia archaeon]|nr:DUF1003 domain-containing protein [Candidatus Nanoarchaeia archaeon]